MALRRAQQQQQQQDAAARSAAGRGAAQSAAVSHAGARRGARVQHMAVRPVGGDADRRLRWAHRIRRGWVHHRTLGWGMPVSEPWSGPGFAGTLMVEVCFCHDQRIHLVPAHLLRAPPGEELWTWHLELAAAGAAPAWEERAGHSAAGRRASDEGVSRRRQWGTVATAGHAQDFYSDSASEDEHFAPAQHVEYMHSMRECWERYDAARDAVENEREEADARLAQAREDLHDELSEAQREWMEDGRYHAERAAGFSPGASDEFSPRSFDSLHDIQQELAHVELRSDDEVHSRGEEASESPLIWDEAMANYFEEQEVDFEAYAHCFEPEEEEYSSQPESEHGPD
jgi:hypothetical protein